MLDTRILRATLMFINQEVVIKQNVTASIDMELLIMGKVIAAKTNSSLHAMLSSMLIEKISAVDGYERARKNALAQLDQEFHFGGKYSQTREALHERKDLR